MRLLMASCVIDSLRLRPFFDDLFDDRQQAVKIATFERDFCAPSPASTKADPRARATRALPPQTAFLLSSLFLL